MTASDLITQTAHVNGECVVINVIAVTVPDILQKLRTGDDYSAVTDKYGKNLKFRGSHKNIFAVFLYRHIESINRNIVAVIDRCGGCSSQQRTDSERSSRSLNGFVT